MVKRRILLVDDEPAILFSIGEFLDLKGNDVVKAESCAEAEDLFRRETLDAVVLDYALPDGNALGLMQRLKELDGSVPIVIITAKASVELAVLAVQSGADQFLVKPI